VGFTFKTAIMHKKRAPILKGKEEKNKYFSKAFDSFLFFMKHSFPFM